MSTPPDCATDRSIEVTSHETAAEFAQVVLDVVDGWYVRSVQTVEQVEMVLLQRTIFFFKKKNSLTMVQIRYIHVCLPYFQWKRDLFTN